MIGFFWKDVLISSGSLSERLYSSPSFLSLRIRFAAFIGSDFGEKIITEPE